MPIKIDRPADFGGHGIVVYMAKSVEEVDQCRAGLSEAGIEVELPEAAVEALFSSGKKSLPIRVNPDDFKTAQGVIDELFPPPMLELPPLEGESSEDDAAESSGAAASDVSGAPSEGPGRSGPALSGGARLETARAGVSREEIEKRAGDTMFLSIGSCLVPGLGILGGAWGIYAGWWCMERLQTGTSERMQAKLAFAFGIVALLCQVGWGLFIGFKLL